MEILVLIWIMWGRIPWALAAPNPGTPVYRDTNEAGDVAINGNYAYVADWSNGLAIIDISDPTNPGTPVYKDTNGFAQGVTISGNYAYVADGASGLAIIDISDPINPGIPIYEDTKGSAQSVTISGSYAYVADAGSSGLAIIDISDPTNPGTPVYRDINGNAIGVTISGNYAYVGSGLAGMAIIDISDPTNPGTPTYEAINGDVYEITTKGNQAYLAITSGVPAHNSGLAIVDISDPTNPGTPVYTDSALNRAAYDVAIRGNYAFLAYSSSGLAIIDISDPTSPGSPVYRDTNGNATGVAISGNYAYVADSQEGLAIIPTNVTDLTDAAGNRATLTLASPGAAGSLGANKELLIGNIATLTLDTTSISEHQSAIITATLDNTSNLNTYINLDMSGTAVINQDYKFNLDLDNKFSIVAGGNGVGTNTNQLNGPEQVAVDSKGSVYVVQNYNTVQKWSLGSLDGETVTLISDSNPITNIKIDDSDNIFILRSSGVVEKFSSSFTLLKTYQAPATGGQYFAFDIANDDDETAYIIDFSVEAVLYKTTVASSTAIMNTSSHFAEGLAIYDDQNIFVVGNNMQLSKYNISTKEIKTYPYYNCRDVMLNSDGNLVVTSDVGRKMSVIATIDSASILMEIIMDDSISVKKVNSLIIKKDFFDSKNIAVNESELTDSGYEEIGISGVAQDITGDYYLSLSKSSSRFGTNFDNTFEDRVIKYQSSPIIEINAGELRGVITLTGIEDKLFSEGTETIILTPTSTNASLASSDAVTISLLDNSITLTKTDDPFIGLSNGAVSWGDYDRDGDKDVAIMGSSSTLGAVTTIYRNDAGTFVNTNQDFVKLYDGDITWIDINKDGYLDLVVSGYNQTPQTILYLNNAGTSFTQDTTANLPQLFSTKMAWGDLDLDGDIDFAMMGINSSEVLESYIGFREEDGYNLIKDQFPALVKGALEMADIDLDGDNDLLYSGEDLGGTISSSIMINSFIKGSNSGSLPSVSKSAIELINTGDAAGLGILMQGKNSTASFTAFNKGSYDFSGITTALSSGDIAAGDFDNNGGTDIVITGEDDNGVATTKLYWDWAGAHEEFDVTLEGLRESTAEWVDYDMDGDLDLFLMGLSETGAKTVLYKTEVVNKKNTKPSAPSNLQTTDQGFGNVKFTWDAPNDDYSSDTWVM